MTKRGPIRLLYPPALLSRAMAGRHNFTNRMKSAFEGIGREVQLAPDTRTERLKTRFMRANSIVHAVQPVDARSLVMRRAYIGAFWRLEPTEERWEFDVAKAEFDPEGVDPDRATVFVERWQQELFGDAPGRARRAGFVYMPLQGLLLEQRGFQSMAPTQMIDAVCRKVTDRPIVATLHPSFTYSTQERAALDLLKDRHAHFAISKAPMSELLRDCDAVICQNSSVAFSGYFFRKPALLFARIDFHHIASNVTALGVDAAFDHMAANRPAFARYLLWFLKENAIGAGSDQAEDQILSAARRAGWDV
jgi:hypothetical protein